MLYACVQTFDVMENLENFWELNVTLNPQFGVGCSYFSEFNVHYNKSSHQQPEFSHHK
jgi:hypothetical protein